MIHPNRGLISNLKDSGGKKQIYKALFHNNIIKEMPQVIFQCFFKLINEPVERQLLLLHLQNVHVR
jgi:hypothetical protein